jgi:heme a synthase
MIRNEATPIALRRFTKVTASSTLFLIFAGAMVTSTESGLAVPDWPLAFGRVFPPMVGGIFYEHGHRLIATTVGLMVVIQAIWLQLREPKRFVRILGWVALGAVIAQGLLGGMTVLFLLPAAISVAHASMAELFFALTVSIAFFASATHARSAEGDTVSRGVALGMKLLAVAVFSQIFIGAVMRHLKAGLVIPDYPLSMGQLIPEFSSGAIAIAFSHRAWGTSIVVLAAILAPRVFRSANAGVRRLFAVFLGLGTLQLLLGGLTIWSGKQPVITSIHVVTGAAIFATSILLALSSHVQSERRPETAEEIGGMGVPA